jgi:hypothetical protein
MLAKDWYKLVDLILLSLKNALGNPNHVTDFLLLELDVSVKYGKVELSFKRQFKHLHIALVKGIVNALFSASCRMDIPNGRVLRKEFQHAAEFVFVRDVGQHGGTGWVQVTNSWVETLAVRSTEFWLVEGGTKGVQRNVDSVRVGADTKDLSHNGGGLASELLDKLVKVLNPVLDERRLDDLNLDFLKDTSGLSSSTFGRLLQKQSKVLSNWSVDEDSLVKIGVTLSRRFEKSDTLHGTVLHQTERVALSNELINVTSREGSLEQEHNVLNHVLVGNEIKEGGERLDGLCSQVFELDNKLMME